MKLLKYITICLTTLSCAQAIANYEETSKRFDKESDIAAWLGERNISGGFLLPRKLINYMVVFGCNPTSCSDKFNAISEIVSKLSTLLRPTSWFFKDQYQVTRIFEKQFTLFGLLSWIGLRNEEKNKLFIIRNAGFKDSGITQTEN